MPELPEVETVKNGLIPYMCGREFISVTLNRPDLRFAFPENFAKRLIGQRLVKLERRAKFLIGTLSNQERLIMHLGMSGRFIVNDARGKANPRHDHVVFKMSGVDAPKIIYNDPRRFGFMDLIAGSGGAKIDKLGPEPLSNHFNGPTLHTTIDKKTASIKSVLLDQRVVAGLGNIYVCEALFDSGIDPTRPANALSLNECEALSAKIKTVLTKAIQAGGSSLKDFARTDGALGYFQHQFQVYGREGKDCVKPSCSGQILRISQSGRSSFYCPACQK